MRLAELTNGLAFAAGETYYTERAGLAKDKTKIDDRSQPSTVGALVATVPAWAGGQVSSRAASCRALVWA